MGDDLPDGLTRLSYSYAGNFSSLLAFGVLTLSSFKGLPGPAPIAPDGWNWAPPLPWIVSRRTSLEGDLEFLCHNDFIRATYKMEGPGKAKVRIYVMPEDCEWYQVRETRVELRGRALLARLKDQVDRCPKVWNGETRTTACGHSYSELLLADDDISLNLSAIFNSLPSPKADEEVTRKESPVVRELMESVLEDDGVPGFRSQLYQYQRESVWKMLQRELIPQKRPDPRLRKWVGPTGRMAWINTDDMTFFSKQQWVDDIPGGILCEEMGTGKTCISLALIVLTLHQRALPPRGTKVIEPQASSLYQQCFNTVINQGIQFRHLDPRPPFFSDLENAMPYYHLKRPPPKRLRRQTQEVPPETIYLSTATLVVVPDTLIQQWTTEILKHVQDNVLNYTVISKPTQPLPSLHNLMKTDILLLSHSRFAKEDDDGCFEERGKNNICRCFPSVFGHPCRCQLTRSPLMRIQWKRLIIDEGHILGQGTTRLVSLAGKLRVERRWCVTGTVSNHMMGMELGMSRTLSTDINGNITPPAELPNRKTEQLDLKRLGNILVDFLHMPPFYNVEIWNRYVVKPYTENIHGAMSSLRSIMTLMIRHRPGDIEMDVKLPPLHTKTVLLEPTKLNRISINVITAMIANNAVLTQRCDQDYMFHASQIKYRDEVIRNLMLSTFHFTATSVEDVLGGIRNAEEGLEKQVKRGYSKEDVKMLEDVVTHLKEALDDDEWRSLAVRNEPGSKEFSPQEMGCPHDLAEEWRLPRTSHPGGKQQDSGAPMFSGPALLSMQSQLPNLAVTPIDQHIPYLNQINQRQRQQLESVRQEALATHLERQNSLQERKNKDGSPRKTIATSPRKSTIRAQIDVLPQRSDEEQKLRKVVKYEVDHYNLSNPSSPRKRPKPPIPLTPPASPPDLANISPSSQTPTGTTKTPSTTGLKSILKVASVPEDIPSTSPLKGITIEKTASAKLNYLLEQIVKHHKDEKIIVFSDQAAVMWYLGEALELLGIQHLIYIQKLMPARRSQYIVTFNSSPHYRVLIMETRIASHGLNVTSASRVYFLSTPWQRSVEKQAIKRAHRIGQTREVFVEKLVLGGTIEEVVVRRREEMGLRELEGKKGFLEDGKVRGIIESARFVSPIGRREEMVDGGDETGEGERGRVKGMVFDGVSGCDGFGEFGRLFNVKEKDDEVDRVLEIIEESEKREKRKAPVAGSTVAKERKNPPGEKSPDRKRKLRFDENEDSERMSKRSMIIRLRIPKVSKDNTRRRVQFVES